MGNRGREGGREDADDGVSDTKGGGGREEEMVDQERLLDFKPLLSDPKHSDIVLKCGDARFLCHKVILATG